MDEVRSMLTNHATDKKMYSGNRKSDCSGDTNGTNGTAPEGTHRNGLEGGHDGDGLQKGHENGERKRERIVVVGLGMVALSFM